MNFGAFFCLHYISVLYFFNFEAKTLIRPFFIKLNVLFLGPVTYSARTQSESSQMSADFIFEKIMYRLDPDKNRAYTRRTVSVRWFFLAPKANVKMMDMKIFTILSWDFFLII